MSHACIRKFDVTGTVEKILGTKHPPNNAPRLKLPPLGSLWWLLCQHVAMHVSFRN